MNELKKLNINISFKLNGLQNFLTYKKPAEHEKNSSVYNISCNDLYMFYIGHTRRT